MTGEGRTIRRFLVAGLVTLAALVGAASATGSKGPIVMSADPLQQSFGLGFTPSRLSKDKPEPIALSLATKIQTLDGSHPQPLQRLVVDLDQQIGLSVKGIPSCPLGLQTTSTGREVEGERCRRALLGEGAATFDVALPARRRPVPLEPTVLAYYGGADHGSIKVWLRIYLPEPVNGAVLVKMRVKKAEAKPFGLQMVATIPKVAGGYGSLTSLSLRINRPIFRAACARSPMRFGVESVFADSTELTGALRGPCRPRGSD